MFFLVFWSVSRFGDFMFGLFGIFGMYQGLVTSCLVCLFVLLFSQFFDGSIKVLRLQSSTPSYYFLQ